MNKVILIGNLGKNPVVSTNGKSRTQFSIATNESWKDEAGVTQKRTEWHNIVTFGGLADICAKSLKQGHKVAVEGRLQTRKFEKEGEKTTYYTEIVADSVEFMSKRESGELPMPTEE